MKIVILAAGIGSRLGNPHPKPLTPLSNGKTILQQQIENITTTFNIDDINLIVGFKKDLIMEAFPDLCFIYNQYFDRTNTSKSLLKALNKFRDTSVLWMNGDVVFDANIIHKIKPFIEQEQSFICVNTASVSDEEVKYILSDTGFVTELSKSVKNGCGEAVGINFIAKKDIQQVIQRLDECSPDDYFERGLELAIEHDELHLLPIDISEFLCIEVDFQDDLERVNATITARNRQALDKND